MRFAQFASLIVYAGLDASQLAHEGPYTGEQPLARGEREEDGGHAKDDGRGGEPPRAEEKTEYAERGPQSPARDVRGTAHERGQGAAHPEEYSDRAGNPGAQQLYLPLAAGSLLLARSPEVFARFSGVVVLARSRSR